MIKAVVSNYIITDPVIHCPVMINYDNCNSIDKYE